MTKFMSIYQNSEHAESHRNTYVTHSVLLTLKADSSFTKKEEYHFKRSIPIGSNVKENEKSVNSKNTFFHSYRVQC